MRRTEDTRNPGIDATSAEGDARTGEAVGGADREKDSSM